MVVSAEKWWSPGKKNRKAVLVPLPTMTSPRVGADFRLICRQEHASQGTLTRAASTTT